MIRKRQNTLNNAAKTYARFFYPVSLLTGAVIFWQMLLTTGAVDAFMLPAPLSVLKTFFRDFDILMANGLYTLFEGLCGLFAGIVLGYAAAISMDRFTYMRKALYPLLVLSQTIPYIAVAPLLVLWFGYNMTPKIILVTLTCFFPLATGIYDGIRNIDKDYIDELNVMGGTYAEGLVFVKIPLGVSGFFSALKIATTYSIVGAVISEWMGGTSGLGVYMTRVRKSYEFDKMFAGIFFIVIISLCLISIVKLIERRVLNHE